MMLESRLSRSDVGFGGAAIQLDVIQDCAVAGVVDLGVEESRAGCRPYHKRTFYVGIL